MAGLPVNFAIPGEGAVASYSFTDFASGMGYRIFYPVVLEDSVGLKYLLTTQVLDCDYNNRAVSANFDLDFDTTFFKPEIVASADAYVNFTVHTGNPGNITLVFNIYHVRSGVETSIGTITSATYSVANGYCRGGVKLAVSQKPFAIGDILRVNVIATATAGTSECYFDPASRKSESEFGTAATISTNMEVYIPFKIDN